MNTNTRNPNDSHIDDESPEAKKIIVTNRMQFHPGQVLATPGSLALMRKQVYEPLQLLTRFIQGDWGDCCHPDDVTLNEIALADGSRLLGVHRQVTPEVLEATAQQNRQDLPAIWLIADATASEKDDPRERNVTTFLLPSEY